MWNQITLRIRICLLLAALISVTLMGGMISIWYSYRMEVLLNQVINKDIAAFQSAEAIEIALVNQKGFLSYYFLDGDPEWLRRLGEVRQVFKERMQKAHSIAETNEQKEALGRIESEYIQYITIKDNVISYYKTGNRAKGAELHKSVRNSFFKILELCEEYKNLYTAGIMEMRENSSNEAQRLRIIVVIAMAAVLVLGFLLVFFLIHHILTPLHRLTVAADRKAASKRPGDEVYSLSVSVRGLIEDAEQAQTELEKSRESLLQAEKMVSVGKLAAGMAHSIRNPLTSVKMRLFSLNRTLGLSNTQKDDFHVISEEINHVDTIVQNFLEFSRAPKLKIQNVHPSELVDMVLQLLRHRLESYDVKTSVVRSGNLPEIQGDPEQLKEVLVNLMENACEAMEGGGQIIIEEEQAVQEPFGRVVLIRLKDNGSGIQKSLQPKIMEPFFTTKEEGTGLGLSIASRIVEEHGGKMDFVSSKGEGTTFIIVLPIKSATPKEHGIERHPDYR